MDYRLFTDYVDMPCCVIRVGKAPDGWGDINIVAANEAYRRTMGPAYYDGMPYYELVPRDKKFEAFCYHAAVLKERMHAYVDTRALGFWTDQTLIPLVSDEEEAGYCQFIFEFTKYAEPDRMAELNANNAESVIKACIRLMGSDDFSKGVAETLDVIIDETGSKGARIVLLDREMKCVIDFCNRFSMDAKPVYTEDPISYELVESWEDIIGVSNAVIMTGEKDLEYIASKNPEWAASLRENLIRSLVLMPLRNSGRVIGYLYVVNFDTAETVRVKELVELMSVFFASGISNHLLMRKLDEMSRIDALTGTGNRRAMIERMNRLSGSHGVSYGIINLDLNGLKTVNDNEGHDAGDRFLIAVSELLTKIFRREDIFRTGGDEFIVIVVGIDGDTFGRKLARLRADAEKLGLAFAVGSFWSGGSDELRSAFRSADERMYADKKAYYDAHRELNRR